VAPTYDGEESVRCIDILRTALQVNLESVHRKRRDAVWRAVAGVILGGQVWLSGLGRALPGRTTDKHRIKAVDRLLGNRALHRELETFYRALAAWLLRSCKMPIIAVDWTGAGAHHYEISAKLCCDGRALALYSQVYPKKYLHSRIAHRRFLAGLAGVLPDDCKPILITDAGFRFEWFREVQWFGWHYIGRIRHRSHVLFNGSWRLLSELHATAGSRAKVLGELYLRKQKPIPHRVILAAQPKPKGRTRWTRRGTRGRRTTDVKASKSATEPWVLVTSLPSNGRFIVKTYALRMQIEQSFRDRKSYRNGWSMHCAATRSSQRMSVLILLSSLAEVAVQLVGRALAGTAIARQFQANTERKRRVLSFFFIGCRAIRQGLPSTLDQLRDAADTCLRAICVNSDDYLARE
jgi:Transposase DDE domain